MNEVGAFALINALVISRGVGIVSSYNNIISTNLTYERKEYPKNLTQSISPPSLH